MKQSAVQQLVDSNFLKRYGSTSCAKKPKPISEQKRKPQEPSSMLTRLISE